MEEIELVNIALFPIPKLVAFPHSVVPLHVFEPRYRKMIEDCLEQNLRIGVSHINKTLKVVEKKPSLEEALRSNQSTYEAQEIFSAGFCELKETTPDGRLLVDIKMKGRFQRRERIQEVPYQVYQCVPYNDLRDPAPSSETLRDQIDHFLLDLAKSQSDKSLQEFVLSTAWMGLSLQEYSFCLFELLQFDPDLAQEILECRSVEERLSLASKILNLSSKPSPS